jgi:hypothetical protein
LENLAPEFIVLTSKTKSHLFSIAKWAKIIALIGFFVMAFGFLVFVYSLGFSGYPNSMNTKQVFLFSMILVFIILYANAIYKLYNFSKYCKKALKENDGILLELSLNNLRQNFKIVGLITLIVSLIYLVLFIAIAIGGSLAYKFFLYKIIQSFK